MSKNGDHPIIKCPECNGEAMLGYKNNPAMGKCSQCHRVFFDKETIRKQSMERYDEAWRRLAE